jgi:putative nucleotidyltransferase with HDIG domain
MARDVEELLDSVDDLPPLPAVATRVMGMVEDDNTNATELGQVLATDQALTAKLIKISNSAYYGFARQVSTVRDAVTLLGFRQVREVAVATSLMSVFNETDERYKTFDLDLFWGHSVAVAVTAEALAKQTRAAKPQDAYTAGILHDIGRLILRKAMPAEFDQAVRRAVEEGVSLGQTEEESTGFRHADIGNAMGSRWKFPGPLLDAVWRHHDETLTPKEHGLAGVVAQSDRLALHFGLFCGYDAPDQEPAPLPADLAAVEAATGGVDSVLDRAFAFIESASGTPGRWYQAVA